MCTDLSRKIAEDYYPRFERIIEGASLFTFSPSEEKFFISKNPDNPQFKDYR